MIEVSALYRYPIKSCRGIAVTSAVLDRRGIAGDRRFMVVDASGDLLSQRELPRMSLVAPRLEGDTLTLDAPGMPTCTATIAAAGPRRQVVVWADRCAAIDQGDATADWLRTFLGTTCRLVRLADDAMRRVDPDFATGPEDEVSFADGFPLLLIGEASLADLNTRLATPLPMNRFRPNIVVRGSAAYAEDDWRAIHIGEIPAQAVKRCARCVTTTVDQATGEQGKEPLRTLAAYRRGPDGGVLFGQNVIHQRTGVLRVGDRLSVLD
jgi:MOSC domain-containing protein